MEKARVKMQMQEVFEKIKEKINEYMEIVYECSLDDVIGFQTNHSDSKASYIVEGFYEAYEIIKQVAEEYNNGWIPVSKRLPEENGRYLVCLGYACACELTFKDGRWFNPYIDNEYLGVTAWQPLPPEYQPKGE